MAWPADVLLMNHISAIMITMHTMMVSMVSTEMVSWPSNRLSGWSASVRETIEIKLLGLDPQESCATCCSK